jgi:uncharacterized protein DUF6390
VTAGPILFARYAYPPNALGYCGPDDSGALGEYASGTVSDAGLVALARRFAGAWPYLGLIANANGRPDPLDPAVVEAYWLGNPLLERIPGQVFAAHVVDRFADRAPRRETPLAELALHGRAHHNFHVFAVYPWVGLLRAGHVEEPLRVLDSCRIRWGSVLSVHRGQTVVRSAPLRWTGRELVLGPARVETASVSPGLGVRVGDTVSLHWDWVCDVIDARQAAALAHYTMSQLRVANRTLRRPVADLVLG